MKSSFRKRSWEEAASSSGLLPGELFPDADTDADSTDDEDSEGKGQACD